MPKLEVLKGKLVENKKTYLVCAKHLGVSVTTFSDKMNGKRKFNVEEVNMLSSMINLSDAEKVDIFLN